MGQRLPCTLLGTIVSSDHARDSHVLLQNPCTRLRLDFRFELLRGEWDECRDGEKNDAHLQRWDHGSEIVVHSSCQGGHSSSDNDGRATRLKCLHALFLQKSLVLNWWFSHGKRLVQIPAETKHATSDGLPPTLKKYVDPPRISSNSVVVEQTRGHHVQVLVDTD